MGSIYSKLPSLPNLIMPLSKEEIAEIQREGREKRLRAYDGATKSDITYSDEYVPQPRSDRYRAWVEQAALERHRGAGTKSVPNSPLPVDENARPVTRVVEGGEGAIV
jgi:hypothetical protein